ncbi:xyloglucan endotransglucosylase protein 7-like [Phragmites australis]|uniref:xyloglucan endotransglucosylase protein 7-like n=1 Tax=Phragmites australis TaxID=29695 RepID=UPI002D79CE61|nr:xyloglucan endotransglucosylase protein 7-like [Phragmites australis]
MRASGPWRLAVLALAVTTAAVVDAYRDGGDHNFHRDFDVVWGEGNARFRDGGRLVELSLDERTGARLQSKDRYLFGRFDLEIKLVPGESAGTITSFYICTGGARHDEVDFEFLGNVSGEPYILHTNIFSDGKGEREQQFVLWFDPTEGFHTYSILWNPLNIILYIDGTPIRVFKNNAAYGVPFPTRQPVHVFASIWDAEDWATQGGRVKTDWSRAPFVATYRRYNVTTNACVWDDGGARGGPSSRCGRGTSKSSLRRAPSWMGQRMDWWSWMTLSWVRMNYMVYDYCADRKRFPHGFPAECIIPIGRS